MPALPTSGTGFGFWPTPCANETGEKPENLMERMKKYGRTGSEVHMKLSTKVQMWPTPRAGNPGSRPNGMGGKVLAEEVGIAEKMRTRGQSLWPTPTAHNAKEQDSPSEATLNTPTLCHQARGGDKTQPKHLNPVWVEWLMGWPLGWTDLKPLETDKYPQWRHSHGGF